MYRLIGRLEQSQLADLFRGERVEAAESVVVKLFHLKTSDAAYARVIADIARQLQTVAHAGVARVLDVGLIDGQLAVVRQDLGKYSLGLALQRLNTREVFLPPALGLTLALELLDAVGAAHSAGVVHGALTPGNILLGADGRVSVADFGALAALQASTSLRTAFGSRGRGSYRSPELGNGDSATVASDLYALGAIIYELLTLREAATGHSAVSTRQERLPPPSRLVRRLHSRIDPVIMRALENSPARRHKSCAEFADGIREFLGSQGGIPPRSDLEKFVGELFPNEVQVTSMGPVPFGKTFELTDVAGVGAIEADAAVAVTDERASFSGGLVDDRTPTSDGLPVFTEEMVASALADAAAAAAQSSSTDASLTTQPVEAVKRAVSEWDAPAAAMPVPVAAPQASQAGPTPQADPLKGRVKVVEDFAAIEGQPKPAPKLSRRQKVAKTIMTFAVPFKREGDPSVPSYEEMQRRGAREVRWVSFVATVILFGVVSGAVYGFLRSTNDVKGTLIGYLPMPFQRAIGHTASDPHPPPPPSGGPITLKLRDFDKLHPERAFDPNPKPDPVEPKKEPVVVKKDPEPVKKQPASDCYQSPKGKTGFLTVESPIGVRVEVDGDRVCTNATKLPVATGSHKITVMEPKTKQEYVSTHRFEAGKVVKLLPVFQKR